MLKKFMRLSSNSRRFLLFRALSYSYFSWPIWYQFANEKLTVGQIGVFWSMVYLLQALLEIPTGAIADKYGRKFSFVLGTFFMPMVPALIFFGHSFWSYIVAAICYAMYGALISGAAESYIHDADTDNFKTISQIEAMIIQVMLIVSAGLGGLLFTVSEGLPFIIEIIFFVMTILLASRLKADKLVKNKNNYLKQLGAGFSEILKSKVLIAYTVFSALSVSVLWVSIDYTNEAMMIHNNINPSGRGLLIAGAKVIGITFVNLVVYRFFHERVRAFIYILTNGILSFFLISSGILSLVMVGYISFNFLSASRYSLLSPLFNKHISTQNRATVLSSMSLIASLTLFLANFIVPAFLKSYSINKLYFAYSLLYVCLIPLGWYIIKITRFKK